MPRVLNHKTRGLPADAVYIGRENRYYGLPESKWHNPYPLRRNATDEERAEAVAKYGSTYTPAD